ncbi:MAG: flagellar motor switch protein FliM [Candidatus Poribacteria bacterium]|nr:MAG: flagellar motor switch protein FliM [Candidatus Poribacteria bacterium]
MLFVDREPEETTSGDIQTRVVTCQSYARALLEARLSSRLKRRVRVDLGSAQFGTFADFESRVDSPSSLCAYLIGDRHRAVLEINQGVAFSIVDLLMGGKGYPPVETRPLSPLEQSLMSSLFEAFAEDLERAWSQLLPFKWRVVQESQYTYSLEQIRPSDRMVIVLFEVGITELLAERHQAAEVSGHEKETVLVEGTIQLAIPLAAILADQRRLQAAATKQPRVEELVQSPLVHVLPLRVQAMLPPATITLRRLLELQEGDVLEFADWEVGENGEGNIEVVVSIEGRPRFYGRLGAIHRKRAVQIQRPMNHDAEAES